MYDSVARSILSVAREVKRTSKRISKDKVNSGRDKHCCYNSELCAVQVIQLASFLSQLMAREFIFTPVSYSLTPATPSSLPLSPQPCEELTIALQEVMDEFVNSEIIKKVWSGHHGNTRLSHLDVDDEDWQEEEFVPDTQYQVSCG